MSLLWNFFDLGLYFHIDNCWDRWYNCKRWLCASAGTGRQARLRCVCLRRTGSSPVSRTRLKTPHGCVVFFVAHCAISAFLPSRESHFVGFAIFIARVSDWHQFRHPNPGKTPHSCVVFFVAQCAISSFSLIANSMFNGGRDFCYPYILKEKKPSFGISPKETCSLPIPKTPVPLLELSPAL